MGGQFDRIEQDNLVLEEEIDRLDMIVLDERAKTEQVSKEKEELKVKYLELLEMYEHKEIKIGEVQEELKKMHKAEEKIKEEVTHTETIIMGDNQKLFKENSTLTHQIKQLKMQLNNTMQVKSSAEKMTSDIEHSHRDLLEKLKLETEQKDLLVEKILTLAEGKKTQLKLIKIEQDEEITNLKAQIDELKTESREMSSENRNLQEKVRELETRRSFLDVETENAVKAEIGSQYENSRIFLDINDTGMDSGLAGGFDKKEPEYCTNVDILQELDALSFQDPYMGKLCQIITLKDFIFRQLY